MNLEDHIRTIPDFPQEGILFRDVTTLFGHPQAFATAVDRLAEQLRPGRPDLVAGIEARGFVLGGAVAVKLGAGFIPVRKKGKLPARTIEEAYQLEYGQAVIEVHEDAADHNHRVVIVDDLIATGGTGLAAIELVKRLGATPVGFGAVIDLPDLGGAERIRQAGVGVEALLSYAGH